jgi:uncharacterized protein YnzC (UPF0291/DUF896 family)
MITPEKIERINALARKSRETSLSDDEKAEQAMLRREYIDAVKTNIKSILDNRGETPEATHE